MLDYTQINLYLQAAGMVTAKYRIFFSFFASLSWAALVNQRAYKFWNPSQPSAGRNGLIFGSASLLSFNNSDIWGYEVYVIK